jgi:hypothetical protein
MRVSHFVASKLPIEIDKRTGEMLKGEQMQWRQHLAYASIRASLQRSDSSKR